jgi:HlyD family secretion protein
MRRKFRFLWPTVIGLAVVALIAYGFVPRPVEADFGAATRGRLLVTVDEDGKTRIRERYAVAAPLAGQLLRVHLEAGDPVEAGKTVLAVIEPTDPALLDPRSRAEVEARVRVAESNKQRIQDELERAREAYQLARLNLDRAHPLVRSGGLTREDYDALVQRERIAQKEVEAAKSAVQVAASEIKLAEAALVRTRPGSPGEPAPGHLPILSPINGRVLRVYQESAAVVAPGTKLLELGDPNDLEMEIDVLSADAVKVRPGARVIIEHWGGGEPLEGRVRVVEPAGFLKVSALGVEEQRVWVIADFTGPPEKRAALGDAYRVEARIVVWEGENVLKVPAGALFRHNGGWAVYAVRDGRAVLAPVEVGHTNGLETELLGGLAEGDAVILHASDRVREGVLVKPR